MDRNSAYKNPVAVTEAPQAIAGSRIIEALQDLDVAVNEVRKLSMVIEEQLLGSVPTVKGQAEQFSHEPNGFLDAIYTAFRGARATVVEANESLARIHREIS